MIALNFGCGTRKTKFDGYEDTINIDLREDVKPDLVADIFDDAHANIAAQQVDSR